MPIKTNCVCIVCHCIVINKLALTLSDRLYTHIIRVITFLHTGTIRPQTNENITKTKFVDISAHFALLP